MTPGLLFEYCFAVVTGIGAGLLVIAIPLAIMGAAADSANDKGSK